MTAIYKRDLKGYFRTPLGFVFLAAFCFFAAYPFSYLFADGSNYVSGVFATMCLPFLMLLSLLTMNILSEERRHKTDQVFLTAPVSVGSVIMGKFLAALTVFTIGMMITVVFAIITAIYVSPDWPLFLSGFLGMYLSGCAVLAIGVFISSLTESQVISAVISIAVTIMIFLMDSLGGVSGLKFLQGFIEKISFQARFKTFLSGVFDYTNIIYFISITALFLFLATRVIERRRWS